MEIAGRPLHRLRERLVEGIDAPLFALALALAAIGLAALYSASYENAARVANQFANLLKKYWHLGILPAGALSIVMLGFSFFGDALRDALDPRALK